MHWAILCGIEGNLVAYEAVLTDVKKQQPPVDEIYILGDVVGLHGDNEAVVRRVRSPRGTEPLPQVCTGWWEEQCFSLHGLRLPLDAPAIRERYGVAAVKQFWDSLSRETVAWLHSLHFGFHELDCLLMHGSTVSYGDCLMPDTSAIQMADRLLRADARNLFCGRAGRTFQYTIAQGQLAETVQTLDQPENSQTVTFPTRRVIGVGNVGGKPGRATYTLYQPTTDRLRFRTVRYGTAKGFQPQSKM